MKILFMPHAVTINHLIRPLMVAKEVKKRGYEVFFGLTEAKFDYLLKKENIPAFPLSTVEREKAIEIVRSYKYDLKETINQLNIDLDSDISLIEKIRPDLVVNDMRFTVKMACRLRSIPYAVILNAYHTGKLATTHTIPEQIFLSRIIPKFLQKKLFKLTHNIMDYSLGAAMRKLAESRGIKDIKNVTQSVVSEKLTLICDIPEYFPCKNLNSHFHYIGPFLWQPEAPVPEWFYKLDSSRPVIYLTLGTSGSTEHLLEILKAFSQKGYQVILTKGGIKFEEEMPKAVYTADFLPALDILEKVNLVVCHGGNGTIYQALSKGVPVIGLPTFYDQEWNSERLDALGVGRRVSLRSFNQDKLVKTADELMGSGRVKENCLRFKEVISGCNAPKAAADLIEKSFKRGGGYV